MKDLARSFALIILCTSCVIQANTSSDLTNSSWFDSVDVHAEDVQSTNVQILIESGVKYVHKTIKGIGHVEVDVRPYIQIGAYRDSGALTIGSAINYAPNIVSSDTKGLFNFKILDMHYDLFSNDSVSMYFGALRQNRNYTAWGYSIGLGYGFSAFDLKVKTNISWSRTNTDIGGRGEETGAKDNIVWMNVGLSF